MYKKEINIKGKKYNYYYHNFKIDGKVKNVCLGNNEEEAKRKLEELVNKDIKQILINRDLEKINFANYGKVFFIMLSLLILTFFLNYISPNLTSLVVYNNNVSNFNTLMTNFMIKELLAF